MLPPSYYSTVLTAHLVGLALLAGSTAADAVLTQQFWRLYAGGSAQGVVLHRALGRLQPLAGAGMVLLILSGVGMMAVMHEVYGPQLWFRIKFGLVLLIILNALAVGRRQHGKLAALLAQEGLATSVPLRQVRTALRGYHAVQLFLFGVVLVLSVFKFNP